MWASYSHLAAFQELFAAVFVLRPLCACMSALQDWHSTAQSAARGEQQCALWAVRLQKPAQPSHLASALAPQKPRVIWSLARSLHPLKSNKHPWSYSNKSSLLLPVLQCHLQWLISTLERSTCVIWTEVRDSDGMAEVHQCSTELPTTPLQLSPPQILPAMVTTSANHWASLSQDNIYHSGTQAVPHKPAPLCTRHRTVHGQGCVITTELLKHLRPWRATQLAFKLRWGWDLTPQCWLPGNPYSSAGSACMARPKTHTDFIIIAILPPLCHQ